ncbi:hypothetical protein [Streptomyces sp. NPDC050804]
MARAPVPTPRATGFPRAIRRAAPWRSYADGPVPETDDTPGTVAVVARAC